MSPEPQRKWTIADYLAYDRESEIRHEFYGGEIFAMSGASRKHNLVNGNVYAALRPQVSSRGCEIYASDMRIRIPATDLCTYPDVVVVCGEPRFEDEKEDTLLNPTLIVEVLSPSTEDYDHGKKFAHYRTLPSLQLYVMVAQDEVRVELFERRQDGRWILSEVRDVGAALELSAAGAKLALSEVYHRVPGV
jgi:Uma2 family endonuclease